MEFKLLKTRVIVEAYPDKKVTDSGIHILLPEKTYVGKVIAIGPGTDDEPMEVKVGDEVMYSQNSGTPVEIEEKSYLLMRQATIYGIL